MTTETTTDQERLKQLEDAVRIARTTQKAAEDKQSKREAELLDHYKSIIRQQLFDEGLIPEANHAVVELDQAAKAFEAEKDRQAKAGTGAKFPVGTRFVEYTNGTMYHRFKEPKPTGRVAVYEIITADSQHHGYSSNPASIGSHVLRILKKDGETSRKYEQFNCDGIGIPWRWKAEDPAIQEQIRQMEKEEEGTNIE
jgi:hypothetical protein